MKFYDNTYVYTTNLKRGLEKKMNITLTLSSISSSNLSGTETRQDIAVNKTKQSAVAVASLWGHDGITFKICHSSPVPRLLSYMKLSGTGSFLYSLLFPVSARQHAWRPWLQQEHHHDPHGMSPSQAMCKLQGARRVSRMKCCAVLRGEPRTTYSVPQRT